MPDKLIVLLLVGPALFVASPTPAAVAAPAENRVSGSAAGLPTLIEIEARLSEEAVSGEALRTCPLIGSGLSLRLPDGSSIAAVSA